MTRANHFIIAALFAAIIGVFGLAPARAAGFPAGAATTLQDAAGAQTEQVRHHRGYRGHRGYGHRYGHYRPVYRHRRYYRPYYYRPAPVYYRRCVNRPRVVWTPYGYVRRWVRVCRY